MGDSEKVIIEIDIDDNTITIVPAEGGIYVYDRDEVNQDNIDRLLGAGASYSVYYQGEVYTAEELEEMGIEVPR